jgi:glycosyltransferase involved in cell wall biosynthesis
MAMKIAVTRPIRIVRIISRLIVGGPAHQACLLTRELNDDLFRSWLLTGQPQLGERENTDLMARHAIQPIRIGGMHRSLGHRDWSAGRAIKGVLHDLNPHIVHTHTAKAGALGRLAVLSTGSRNGGAPRLVHTFHGHVFSGYFGSRVTMVLVAIERLLARFTDAIIAVSPSVQRDLVEVYKIAPAEKVRIVELGLDFQWVERLAENRGTLRRTLGVSDDVVLVGMVGRLAKVKNHSLALRAFRRIVVQENLDARLIIFGDGEMRSELESLGRQLRIEDRVSFMGWELDQARMFCDLDLTCLSSKNEGTPVALIESLAAGVPIVSTLVGGVKDVARDWLDGPLVEASDESGFAEALAALGRSRWRISDGRAAEVRKRYSCKRLVSDMKALYTELLEAKLNV